MAAFTVFSGDRRVFTGARTEAEAAARAELESQASGVMMLDDDSGRVVDFDPRPPSDPVVEAKPAASKPGRGRPRLGVVPREVTLLPRHWEWLAAQPGGASAALRRLVDQARRDHAQQDLARAARDAAHAAMTTLAGNRPGYEDALRALYAGDTAEFDSRIAAWPRDIADYVLRLAAAGQGASTTGVD